MSDFLKACRREKVTRTPVWLMRQAGRYMKDYRELRAKRSFLELCKDPDLACEVAVTAQEKIGADAAILFSDILLILEPMGLRLEFTSGDGPAIKDPVRTSEDVDRLVTAAPEDLGFVLDAVKRTKKKLKPGIPLIGFAGGPFTLASYMIEGGSARDFTRTRGFMAEDPGRWKALMKKIVDGTARYLSAQIRAGADVVQVFDSWAGVLTPEEYKKFVLPHSRELFMRLPGQTPTIHFATNTAPFLESFAEAGGDVIGIDHRMGLGEAWERIGTDRAIQGNLDPNLLLGDLKTLENEVKKVFSESAGRPGHIFNLGHGVLPQTPLENVQALVDMVHSLGAK
jgi:uroporphyrinogen decarboxylase